MDVHSQDQLQQLFGAYFHEDWRMRAETPDDVIKVVIAQHPEKNELAHLADLIDAYITEIPDDQELERALFEELKCYYYTDADGLSARSWMRDVSHKLRAASERAS